MFFPIGVTSTLIINIVLKEVELPGYVFVLVVLAFQIVANMGSETLEHRKRKYQAEKQSLLSAN